MIYGSVCSGIEAATVAWEPLGWRASFFSEIERFPRQVLAHHYPDTPLHGDFTTIGEKDYEPIELLVGGTPCQAFSVAGLRKGFSDERGNLTLEFVRLAQRLRPRWLVWENVPGVLSIDGGRAFGAFLGGLAECGYGFAYRILDAQHFGVPQRRRRVFVVGYFGDWRRAAQVLFEQDCLRGDITPLRSEGEEVAGTFKARARSGGWGQDIDLAAGGYMRPVETAKCLTSRGAGCQNLDLETSNVVFYPTQDPISSTDGTTHALGCGSSNGQASIAVAIPINTQLGLRGETSNSKREGIGVGVQGDPAFTLQANHPHGVAFQGGVRRLTPEECEALQGFPRGYTKITDKTADGPRYKALGNSMAVPCMRWIGERINEVEG